jgi:hypothetical protein
VTAAQVQDLTVRAMWMALAVVDSRLRTRFARVQLGDRGTWLHAREARDFERKIAALADQPIAYLTEQREREGLRKLAALANQLRRAHRRAARGAA